MHLFCKPSKIQCDMYKDVTSKASKCITSGCTSESLCLLNKVRKICCHPCLLYDDDHIHVIDKNISSVSASGKLEVLEALLLSTIKHQNGTTNSDKVVIVSNFTSTLTLIENTLLKNRNWPFLRLDGNTDQSTRQTLVDSFNRGNSKHSFIFLLSAKAGGCGLNLVGANRLIMFDPDWNPATDLQAMARVYRQGQTKHCFIYRFFTSGTVEEVIYHRQIQKNNIATFTIDQKNALVNRTDNFSVQFSNEELHDCFILKECESNRIIDGPESLRIQGCLDEPILTLTENKLNVLTYVHLVND